MTRERTMRTLGLAGVMIASLTFCASPALAQATTNSPPPVAGAKAVTIEHVKVHAPSIEGNLEGESADRDVLVVLRSEEHTSELQSLMRISYAVFCLKKKSR